METILTERLCLVPCSSEMARAIIQKQCNFAFAKSSNWPLEDIKDFLPTYIELLESDPLLLGWGVWLMIHTLENKVIGDLGFKGRPDKDGIVEIGYSIVPEYRRRGYTFEATIALVKWAFAKDKVNKIYAECAKDNIPSIKILEKLGMKKVGLNNDMIKWELKNDSGEEHSA